jgi:hypothetical protein
MASDTDTADTAASPAPPTDGAQAAPRVLLSRDFVVTASDGRRYQDVPVDEWKPGAVIRVSSLSSEMRDLLENYLIEQRKKGTQENVRAFYVWLCAVDADGKRLFSDPADVGVLGNMSAVPIDRIFRVTLRLNDVGDAAVETEAKNSEREGSATSSSPSR